jgi:hypothetical protein
MAVSIAASIFFIGHHIGLYPFLVGLRLFLIGVYYGSCVFFSGLKSSLN